MNPRVSPYLKRIRDWKMQQIVDHYLKGYELFMALWALYRQNKKMSFADWCQLCDLLFEAKEGNNLLFYRKSGPESENRRQSGKYIPTTIEASLMNNVGLLFHKAMVMRERQYVQDQYVEDSNEFQQSQNEIGHILVQMKRLYTEGCGFLLEILKENGDNMPLLSFFIEKKAVVERLYKTPLHKIFESHFGVQWLEKTYGAVRHYFEASGWTDRAESVRCEIEQIKSVLAISENIGIGATAPE